MRSILSILMVMVFITFIPTPALANQQASEINSLAVLTSTPSTCHFGIAVLTPFTGYDLSTLGIGNYLDWSNIRNSSVPANIDYYRVLYLNSKYPYDFAWLMSVIPGKILKNPGAIWIVGNEPDSEVTYQDHLSAADYGQRYYEIATLIRRLDPNAKLGFGPIIQPSPVRIYYLTLAINKLAELAGGAPQAHALIDFYPIHAFLLNEARIYGPDGKPINWGAGVPVGYDPATWPTPELINLDLGETYKTYDINIFEAHVIAFRQWMAAQGEQNKPLWITEFGSLFPSEGNRYRFVSANDSANFMAQTYDFMLGYKNPQIGYAADDFRLVQKWTWYSLNDKPDSAGGSLYNPVTKRLTAVGERFVQYDPPLAAVPVTDPDVYVVPGSLVVTPISASDLAGHAYYKVTVKVSNNISSDRKTGVQIDVYDGATLIGSSQAMLPRCSGMEQVSYILKSLDPGGTHIYSANVSLLPGNGTDLDLSNNVLTFDPVVLPGALPVSAIIPEKVFDKFHGRRAGCKTSFGQLSRLSAPPCVK